MYSRKATGDHLFTYSPVAVQPLARVTTTPKLTIPANAAMTTELMAAFSISSYLIQSRCTDFLPKMEKTADCHQLSTDLCALLAQSSELLRIHHSHTALQGCTIVGWYRRRRKEIPWRILCLLNLQRPGPTAVWRCTGPVHGWLTYQSWLRSELTSRPKSISYMIGMRPDYLTIV